MILGLYVQNPFLEALLIAIFAPPPFSKCNTASYSYNRLTPLPVVQPAGMQYYDSIQQNKTTSDHARVHHTPMTSDHARVHHTPMTNDHARVHHTPMTNDHARVHHTPMTSDHSRVHHTPIRESRSPVRLDTFVHSENRSTTVQDDGKMDILPMKYV